MIGNSLFLFFLFFLKCLCANSQMLPTVATMSIGKFPRNPVGLSCSTIDEYPGQAFASTFTGVFAEQSCGTEEEPCLMRVKGLYDSTMCDCVYKLNVELIDNPDGSATNHTIYAKVEDQLNFNLSVNRWYLPSGTALASEEHPPILEGVDLILDPRALRTECPYISRCVDAANCPYSVHESKLNDKGMFCTSSKQAGGIDDFGTNYANCEQTSEAQPISQNVETNMYEFNMVELMQAGQPTIPSPPGQPRGDNPGGGNSIEDTVAGKYSNSCPYRLQLLSRIAFKVYVEQPQNCGDRNYLVLMPTTFPLLGNSVHCPMALNPTFDKMNPVCGSSIDNPCPIAMRYLDPMTDCGACKVITVNFPACPESNPRRIFCERTSIDIYARVVTAMTATKHLDTIDAAKKTPSHLTLNMNYAMYASILKHRIDEELGTYCLERVGDVDNWYVHRSLPDCAGRFQNLKHIKLYDDKVSKTVVGLPGQPDRAIPGQLGKNRFKIRRLRVEVKDCNVSCPRS